MRRRAHRFATEARWFLVGEARALRGLRPSLGSSAAHAARESMEPSTLHRVPIPAGPRTPGRFGRRRARCCRGRGRDPIGSFAARVRFELVRHGVARLLVSLGRFGRPSLPGSAAHRFQPNDTSLVCSWSIDHVGLIVTRTLRHMAKRPTGPEERPRARPAASCERSCC